MYLCPLMSSSLKKEVECKKTCALRIGEDCALVVYAQEQTRTKEILEKIHEDLSIIKTKT